MIIAPNEIRHSPDLPVILLCIGLLLYAATVHAGLKPGQEAPAFTLTKLDGTSISLHQLTRQGPVMLVFWESECVYCFMHIKEFNALQKKYRDKGLTIAAVNLLGEPVETIREYASENQVEYMMLTGRAESIDVTSNYKVFASPTIVLIAPDKKLLFYGHKTPDIERWFH